MSLRAYRRLSAAATPLTALLLSHRLKRGKEHPGRIGERRGESSVPRPEGPLIWIHGASVGELLASFSLIDRLRAENFGILVTSGTVTSAALAKERLPADVIHQFVPLDTPRFVRDFLDHWKPDLTLFIESDLWPNLIVAAAKRRVPLIVINGRLSEHSFQRWRALSKAAAALLRSFDLCLAQSALDGERFSRLGAANVQVTGNLKLDVPALGVDAAKLKTLKEKIGGRPVVGAASTHPGEEAAMLEVHRRLRTEFPELLTIIAPRHPHRGPGILDMVAAAGISASLRSKGQLPEKTTEIYIADTMGELGLLYTLAPAVFIGGSLVDHGGQNPIEAIKLGAATLHGENVWNFAEIYAALDAAHGSIEIADPAGIAVHMATWLKDPTARAKIATAGLKTATRLGGALDRTLAALQPYLMQLRLERRADNA